MHSLLRFWTFFDSIATLTTDVSVFGPLSVADTLGVKAPLRNNVVNLSRLGLTTGNFAYLRVGPPQEIHHHVWFEGFQRLQK